MNKRILGVLLLLAVTTTSIFLVFNNKKRITINEFAASVLSISEDFVGRIALPVLAWKYYKGLIFETNEK